MVQEGQVLFLIDSSSTKAELARTQALVAQAQANLDGVKLRSERILKLFEDQAVSDLGKRRCLKRS